MSDPSQPGPSRPAVTVRFLDRRTPPHIVTLVLISGLAALSMNIFLPSLPGMALWFDAPYRQMQLSVSLYLALSAALQLVVGPLSDRYGRRRIMLGAATLFLLATVGTLLAPTVEVFLVCRMVQAVIATGMVLSRAIVRDMVPDEQAASMIGYVTMGMALVPMVGPMIGGALDEAFGWQASFLALLGLGVLVTLLIWADLGETSVRRQTSLIAQFSQYPALLTSRRFWGYAAAGAFSSAAFFSFIGGAPYVGSEVFGLSPSQLGAYFAAPAVGYMMGNYVSGRYSVRFGMVRMILAGCLVLAGGVSVLLGLTLWGISHPSVFFGFIILVGLGNGMILPNANAGMMSVRPDLAGTASGLGGAMTIGSGAIASAVAGTLLERGDSEVPLVAQMLVCSVVSVISILLVVRRNRRLGI